MRVSSSTRSFQRRSIWTPSSRWSLPPRRQASSGLSMRRRVRCTASPTSQTSPKIIRLFRSRSTTSTKDCASRLLIKHTDASFVGVVFRPATVCGYAPRLRLDLSVNILTNHASQRRQDHRLWRFANAAQSARAGLLRRRAAPASLRLTKRSQNETFNVGYQNLSIMDIAKLVQRVVEREFPERGEVGHRHNAERRFALLSHQFRQD